MGVDRTDYVMLGHKANYDFFKHIDEPEEGKDIEGKAYEKYIEPYDDNGYQEECNEGLAVVADGMSGEYAMIGMILHKSVYNGNGIPLKDFNTNTELEKTLLAELITEKFKIKDPEIKLWIFTHWH